MRRSYWRALKSLDMETGKTSAACQSRQLGLVSQARPAFRSTALVAFSIVQHAESDRRCAERVWLARLSLAIRLLGGRSGI